MTLCVLQLTRKPGAIAAIVGRVGGVPRGEVWVHCASGYRASVAASILATHGIPVVVVDGSFEEQAAPAGLPLTDGAVETTSLSA